MISQASEFLVSHLDDHSLSPEDRETCLYGCEILLYTIISTIGLFTIGCVLGFFPQSIIIVFVFYTLQSFGGGYHAKSHVQCFITMALGLLFCCTVLLCCSEAWIYLCASMIGCIVLLCRPLTLHKHKTYLLPKKKKIANASQIVSVILGCITFSLFCFHQPMAYACSLGIFVSALSRTVAFWFNKK